MSSSFLDQRENVPFLSLTRIERRRKLSWSMKFDAVTVAQAVPGYDNFSAASCNSFISLRV
jgi:hypothetical protein